ncbi:hypothetical protein MMC16_001919 [Acarospora aff. strigata]|nr:hypothetical protein [Acarospora aff. strigata]
MSLGSHIFVRSTLSRSIKANLLAAPRDPFLFLYPRWFSSDTGNHVDTGARAAVSATKCQGLIAEEEHASDGIQTVGYSHTNLPSPDRNDRTSEHLLVAQGSSGSVTSAASKWASSSSGPPSRGSEYGHSVPFREHEDAAETDATGGVVAPTHTPATLHAEAAERDKGTVVNHLTPKLPNKLLVRAVRAARNRHKHLADKDSVNTQLKDKGMLSFDWRIPLDMLEQQTFGGPAYFDQGEERILVREDILPAFTGDIGETLWDIKVRSGCEIHVLGKEEGIGTYRSVMVRGSPSSIEMAKEAMIEFCHGVLLESISDSEKILVGAAAKEYQERRKSPVRKTWTKETKKILQLRVDQIARPRAWTTLSFVDYVADITRSTVSRLMHRHLYKDDDPHVKKVAQELRILFKDPQYQDFVSVQAFNHALEFLYRYNMVSTLRTLFVRMEELNLRMLPETFNIMLRGAAARKDLHTYTFLLRLMIKRGVKPNGGSWVALLMAVPSRAVQMRIESSMRKRGLLGYPATVKEVASLMVSGELTGHLGSGQDLKSFMGRIDGIYGLDWVSLSSLNRILDVTCEGGSFSQVLDALELFRDRSIHPNSVSLNTILSHCHRQGNINEAVRQMQHIHSGYMVEADEVTYHILFLLGWKARHYNVCRMVWRHACMAAAVSYRMQQLVLRSLLRNTPTQPKTKTDKWITSAGKVTVGITVEQSMVAKLVGWSATGAQREETLAMAKQILAQDLSAVQNYRPAHSLVHQLTEGLALDGYWTREHLWTNTSTTWKLENAISIPLVSR